MSRHTGIYVNWILIYPNFEESCLAFSLLEGDYCVPIKPMKGAGEYGVLYDDVLLMFLLTFLLSGKMYSKQTGCESKPV